MQTRHLVIVTMSSCDESEPIVPSVYECSEKQLTDIKNIISDYENDMLDDNGDSLVAMIDELESATTQLFMTITSVALYFGSEFLVTKTDH